MHTLMKVYRSVQDGAYGDIEQLPAQASDDEGGTIPGACMERRLQVLTVYGFGAARAFSAQDARGTSSKLIVYGTLLENTVEFVREFAALQTHTK